MKGSCPLKTCGCFSLFWWSLGTTWPGLVPCWEQSVWTGGIGQNAHHVHQQSRGATMLGDLCFVRFFEDVWGVNVYVEVGTTYKRNQFSLQGQPSTEAIHGWLPPHNLSFQGEAAGSCRDGRWVNSSSVFSFCVQKSQGDPDKVPNTYKA